MHEIVVVPDEMIDKFPLWNEIIQFHWDHFSYEFRQLEDAPKLKIYPHKEENTINFDLFRIAIWCRRNNFHLHSFGSLNYFPLHSLIGHQATMLDDPSNLCGIYGRLAGLPDGSIGIDDIAYSFYRPNGGSLHLVDGEYKEVDVNGNTPLTPWVRKIKQEVTDQDVVDQFKWMKVYIRQSTYNLWEQLTNEGLLPKNSIWCEVKYEHNPHFKLNTYPAIDMISKHDFGMPVVGLDEYKFQRAILDRSGQHYLGLQILCSLLSDCYFLCLRGSANLISLLPIKCICYSEAYLERTVVGMNYWPELLYDDEFDPPSSLLKKLLIERYGKSLEKSWVEPWERPHEGLRECLSASDEMIQAMQNKKPKITFLNPS